MKLSTCIQDLEAHLVSGSAGVPERTFAHVVVSDLMSDVLVVDEDEFLLVTSLASDQVVRTADIVGAAAILLCNGKNAPETMKKLSDQNRIPLFATPLRTFDVCRKIVACGESAG